MLLKKNGYEIVEEQVTLKGKFLENKKMKVDSYGCGDSFAAGILYGLASKWDIDKSLNLAKVMGRDASEFFGPYANNDEK